MKFQEWISQSKELIDMIREIPVEFIKSTVEYKSQYFSFLFNSTNNSITYKLLKRGEPVSSTTTGGTLTITGTSWNIQSPIMPMTTHGVHQHQHHITPQQSSDLLQVSITVLESGEILDLKFIEKTDSSGYLVYNGIHDWRNEDNGKLYFNTLYISDEKMMVNGKIYDVANSPEAFNEDLMNDDVSILSLHDVQTYFNS